MDSEKPQEPRNIELGTAGWPRPEDLNKSGLFTSPLGAPGSLLGGRVAESVSLPVGADGSRQRALVAEPLTGAPSSSERLAADLFASALADDELILSRLDALEELLELLIGDLA